MFYSTPINNPYSTIHQDIINEIVLPYPTIDMGIFHARTNTINPITPDDYLFKVPKKENTIGSIELIKEKVGMTTNKIITARVIRDDNFFKINTREI